MHCLMLLYSRRWFCASLASVRGRISELTLSKALCCPSAPGAFLRAATTGVIAKAPNRNHRRNDKSSPRYIRGNLVWPNLHCPPVYKPHQVRKCYNRKNQSLKAPRTLSQVAAAPRLHRSGSTALEMPLEANRAELMLFLVGDLIGERDG